MNNTQIIKYNIKYNYVNNFYNNLLIENNIIKDNKEINDINDLNNIKDITLNKINFYKNIKLINDIINSNDDKTNYNNDINKLKKIDDLEQIESLDAWDEAINDDKFYINNKIARIFPYMKKFTNYGNIKIDDESFSFITIREIADLTSKIICYHLLNFNINPQKITIIDYTAGVGGNILSFCKFFQYVYAIEIDKLRCDYLINNIDIYGYKNISVINDCAIKIHNNKLIEINPSVIFLDPPWGGNDYKNSDILLLKLGEMKIEELIIDICNKFSLSNIEFTKNNCNKLIILKLPRNYDIEFLYNYLEKNNQNNYSLKKYIYIFNKMIILLCELKLDEHIIH
jgi:16S rRNA G966 N2-methylase RsmD